MNWISVRCVPSDRLVGWIEQEKEKRKVFAFSIGAETVSPIPIMHLGIRNSLLFELQDSSKDSSSS